MLNSVIFILLLLLQPLRLQYKTTATTTASIITRAYNNIVSPGTITTTISTTTITTIIISRMTSEAANAVTPVLQKPPLLSRSPSTAAPTVKTETSDEQKPAWSPLKQSKSYASMLRFWGKTIESKLEHAAEIKLLSQGGIEITGADSEPQEIASGKIPGQLLDVEIDSSGNYIHTLAIKKKQLGNVANNNLVITHGYFTGLGFFFRNYAELSKVDNWDVYSIDWLGMGRSSRPEYLGERSGSEDQRVACAERFFVSRSRSGASGWAGDHDPVGHSFGGYMSALYAMKYPERVEKLILISPIGVPEPPAGYDEVVRRGVGPNYTPQWVVRLAGPFGQRIINWYIGRFTWLNNEQRVDLAAYAHQISVLRGSSETALGDILKPGAFARKPLVQRFADQIKVPTVFMYGMRDWVDYTGGEDVLKRIGGRVAGSVHRVAEAGHNLHMENPAGFNSEMKKGGGQLRQTLPLYCNAGEGMGR
ncbi:Alpha/Beta hydrolase protein [Kickxella alabastrina]|uniref:Alpha/Beta hydrolase protein n=1 Tax=Kickxella alabastrina TaxID=61397 RepID=UPI00221F404E|nr:Alpha/Beta hydrolase protein [Kickxella alabastrina]KAI7827860.1 Alpha/Beta hydrolase protein [Kickxella alabastrina]